MRFQHDAALRIAPHAARNQLTGHIDGLAHQALCARRRHENASAIGAHRAVCRDQRAQRPPGRVRQTFQFGSRHADREEPVAAEIQRHQIARPERHRAQPRFHHALIDDARADQRHRAALGRANSPAIGHNARTPAAAERGAAREKIGIRDIERGGHERAGVHNSALRDRHAVRIDQHHHAGRGKRAGQHRGRIAQHAVQRRRIRARLVKINAVGRANIEARPIDDRAVGALTHDKRTGLGVVQRCSARGDLPPLRQISNLRERRRGQAAQRRCNKKRRFPNAHAHDQAPPLDWSFNAAFVPKGAEFAPCTVRLWITSPNTAV